MESIPTNAQLTAKNYNNKQLATRDWKKKQTLYSTINYFPETSSRYHKFEAKENRLQFPISKKATFITLSYDDFLTSVGKKWSHSGQQGFFEATGIPL